MSEGGERRLRTPRNPKVATDAPSDYTSEDAPGRYLKVRLLGATFGTEDKFQAGAILLIIFSGVFWLIADLLDAFIPKSALLPSVSPVFDKVIPLLIGAVIGRSAPR